jgi:enterochelin esterase-like enzyme
MKSSSAVSHFLLSAVGLVLIVALVGCTSPNGQIASVLPEYGNFDSFSDFENRLTLIANEPDDEVRQSAMQEFWDSLRANKQIPFVLNDSVAFLFKGDGNDVFWAGDFNGWNPSRWEGERVGLSDVFIYTTTLPSDARLDYKIVIDGNWKLDPSNDYVQYSGWGPNSELRMPEWKLAVETLAREDIAKGDLSDNRLIQSENLSYSVQYKVYTPSNYAELDKIPVIYVTDGHEYADQKLGAMVTILDNLIYDEFIEPIIAVFIDPRNPSDLSINRRAEEYRGNQLFIDFVADELTNTIEAEYKASALAQDRAILGTSYGGLNSGYFGVRRSDKFNLIGIHSPAFTQDVIDEYKNATKLPLTFYLHTGVIYDTKDQAQAMREVLSSKGYDLEYIEVNQGHSWGNWRSYIRQPLELFFGRK